MSVFGHIPHISLNNPHPNWADKAEDFDGIRAIHDEIRAKLAAGEKVYVGYLDGERAGSIAYIRCEDPDYRPSEDREPRPHMHAKGKWTWHCGLYVILGWEKRPNRVKCSLGRGMVYFPNYQGPTVWEKFNRKAAEKKATEAVVVTDRDGKVLKVGDVVFYINARYGSAARLDRGIITEIRVKVSKGLHREYSQLNLIIDNEEEGVQSKIKKPELSVLKVD